MSEFLKQVFFPTPKNIILRMLNKINNKGDRLRVLEPSAGKGDIAEALLEYRYFDVYAIEQDETLRATLRGKNIKLLDRDFLTFEGPDKFDLIVANPPYNDGARHLLKMIDIMYSGQIICLLNAQTIKNPCDNIKKALATKLKELNADVEFISGAFVRAERRTAVEIALVNITIDRKVETDIFNGADDQTTGPEVPEDRGNEELATKRKIRDMVAEYNDVVRIGTETLLSYYKNYRKVGKYIALNEKPSSYRHCENIDSVTPILQSTLNEFLGSVRVDFWERCLEMPEVKSRMTSKRLEEFNRAIRDNSTMDFTESNIRQFVLNLINSYEQTLTDAVLEIFDLFSRKHSFGDNNLYEENIHYFNGWKTNKSFMVNKKVIIPIYASYCDSPFLDNYSKKWKLQYGAENRLNDIDIVMNYFDGSARYLSIVEAIKSSFEQGVTREIKSKYFSITCYKKGTIHLTFNSDDILRRFNVAACKGRNWLPGNYGSMEYAQLTTDEKALVDSFEGEKSYKTYIGKPVFAERNFMRLAETN